MLLTIKCNLFFKFFQVELETSLGAIHILMCPRQLHKIIELAEGLSSPSKLPFTVTIGLITHLV